MCESEDAMYCKGPCHIYWVRSLSKYKVSHPNAIDTCPELGWYNTLPFRKMASSTVTSSWVHMMAFFYPSYWGPPSVHESLSWSMWFVGTWQLCNPSCAWHHRALCRQVSQHFCHLHITNLLSQRHQTYVCTTILTRLQSTRRSLLIHQGLVWCHGACFQEAVANKAQSCHLCCCRGSASDQAWECQVLDEEQWIPVGVWCWITCYTWQRMYFCCFSVHLWMGIHMLCVCIHTGMCTGV